MRPEKLILILINVKRPPWNGRNRWTYFPPILIIVGTYGNLLTITVLMQIKNRTSATSIYLTTLASCDLIVLWAPLFMLGINYAFNIELISSSSINCKLFFFLEYISLQFSSVMIATVTSERAFSVMLPHQVKRKCIPGNAVAISGVICACLFFVNVHWLFGVGLKTATSNTYNSNTSVEQLKCRPLTMVSKQFKETMWPWIDLSIFYIFPVVVLIVGSTTMIASLRSNSHKRQNQIVLANTISTNQTSRNRAPSQVAKILLILDVVFVVCTTQVSFFMTIFTDALSSPEESRSQALHELLWAVVNMLMFLNNTINFVHFFLSSLRFRNEVKSLMCWKKHRSRSDLPLTVSQRMLNAETDMDMNRSTRNTRKAFEPTLDTSIAPVS